jgi:hypothetical protein
MPQLTQLTQLIDDDQGIRTAIALALAIVVILSQHLVGGSRHPYIKPVEYERSEFDLDRIPPERLPRMMRFNKEEIRLLVDYFAIDRLVASSRVIEFEPGSWLAKTRFGSEILARVFGSGQRVGMKYLAYNLARLAKTRKI